MHLPGNELINLIDSLQNSGDFIDPDVLYKYSLASLAGLSPLLWHAMPLVPEKQEDRKIHCQTDFVELAVDKWIRSHRSGPAASSVVLYHLMNVAMHTNFLAMQKYAHRWSSDRRGSDKDKHRIFILRWIRSRHYAISKWHAWRILDIVEHVSNVTRYGKDGVADTSHSTGRSVSSDITEKYATNGIEGAHVPYAVYWAVMVLWCGAELPDEKRAGIGLSSLTRGRSLLAQHRLRIASILERDLRRIDMVKYT
jgi:hypothetical protein